MTGAKWISSMAIHLGGDNLLLGTFDKKVQWFDLDLSSMPYQVWFTNFYLVWIHVCRIGTCGFRWGHLIL
jgi:hypothetical protein